MPQLMLFRCNRRGFQVGCLLAASLAFLITVPASVVASSLRRTAIVEAVSNARPSVVSINGRKTLPTEYDANGTADAGHQVNGMGTGIMIDERGYIITNYHVVEGVKRIRVTLADGTTVVAEIVANDPQTDLAIIKIPEQGTYPVIRVGTSRDAMPGETVIAVGNAYGYEHTVTQGIISALHRTVQVSDYQKYADLIQTDASINPGNSGGPLLNIDGDMIGINVAVRVGAQGIGFAIPVDEAMEVAAGMLDARRVASVSYGAQLKTDYVDEVGRVVVESVDTDGPAKLGGLQAGDIVMSVGDRRVERRLDVERALFDSTAGDSVAFTVLRNGSTHAAQIVLTAASKSASGDSAWSELGVRLTPVPTTTFRKYRSKYRGGLSVVEVREGSPAQRHGIREGDVLVGMHKWETISEDNVTYILSSAEFKATQPFKFYILRDGETLFGNMRLDDVR